MPVAVALLKVGRDDDRGALVVAADQVEEELAAGLSGGSIAELVENDEVEAGQIVGHAALFVGPGLGLQPVDRVEDVEEAAAGAASDEGAGDRDGEVGFAGPCAAYQDDVALVGDEVAGGQVLDQTFVDWRAGEVELLDVLGQASARLPCRQPCRWCTSLILVPTKPL